MPTIETQPVPTARQAALLAVARARREGAPKREAVLARHPATAELEGLRSRSGPGLDELLWAELERSETKLFRTGGPDPADADTPSARTPASYYQRRRAIVPLQKWRLASRGVAAWWRSLIDLPASQVKSCCTGLGLAFVVVAMRGQPREAVRTAVAPLGADLGQRVIDRLTSASDDNEVNPLSEPLRSALVRLGERLRGRDLCVALAQGSLATLFHALPPDTRYAAAGVARSNLIRLLEGTTPLTIADPAAVARLSEVVESALRGLHSEEANP